MAGLKQLNWASEGVGATAAALVDLSTVAGNKISNPPWVKFQSAGWVNFPSAPTIMAPLLALQREGLAPGPFSLRGSVTIAPSTALDIFTEIGTQLAETGLVGQRFTWRHMRATIETHLAALGVSQERRAWLLSHGRSGVQAKHYDRYNYLPEKRFDLERWADYLEATCADEGSAPVSSNVVPLKSAISD